MSRVACVKHPADSRFVMLRDDYLAVCDGDRCAAMLLSVFEQWTDTRLNNPFKYEDEWVYRALDELANEDHRGLFKRKRVMKGIDKLIALGFIERRNNLHYAWDRTFQYRLAVEVVQRAINALIMQSPERDDASSRKGLSIAPKGTFDDADSTPSRVPKGTSNTRESTKESVRDSGRENESVRFHSSPARQRRASRGGPKQQSALTRTQPKSEAGRNGGAREQVDLAALAAKWGVSPRHVKQAVDLLKRRGEPVTAEALRSKVDKWCVVEDEGEETA